MSVSAGTAFIDLLPRLAKGFAQKVTGELDPMLTQVGPRAETMGKSLTKHVTAPIIGMAAISVKMAMDVDKGLREVNTMFGLTGEAAEKSFKSLQSGVAGLSQEIGVAQNVLVKGLYQAISAGVPRENAFDFMKVASKAAIAGVTDTETAVDGLTSIINAFGLQASDAGKVADSMFTTVKGGKTNFAQLSDAMFNVAPLAASAKVGFQEVNAAIAAMTSQGVPTSVATTQIRAALQGLLAPSEEITGIFNKLGFQSAQAAIEQKGFGFALDAVKDAAGGDQGKLQGLLGSIEAVGAANILAGTGAEKFAAEMKNQATSAGATETAFNEMEKSGSRSMEKLKTSLGNAGTSIGTLLLPSVEKITGGITTLATKFSGLEDSQKSWVTGIGLAVAAIGPMLLGISKLAFAVGPGGSIRKHLQGLKLAFEFLKSNPIILLATGIAIAVVLIIKHWDKIKAAFQAAGEFIGNIVGKVKDFFLELPTKIGEAVTGILTWFSELPGKVGAFLLDLLVKLVEFIPMAIGWAVGFGLKMMIAIGQFFIDLPGNIWDLLVKAFNFLKDFIPKAVAWAVDFGGKVIDAIVDFFIKLPGRVWDWLGKLGDKIREVVPQLVQKAKDLGRDIVEGIIGFIKDLPSKIGDIISNMANWGRDIIDKIIEAGKKLASKLWEGFKKGLFGSPRTLMEYAILDAFGRIEKDADSFKARFRDFTIPVNANLAVAGVPTGAAANFSPAGVPTDSGGPLAHIENVHITSMNPKDIAKPLSYELGWQLASIRRSARGGA